MIRKLTLAATLAATALALIAAAAPAANADYDEFYVTDKAGEVCWSPCIDSGRQGEANFVSSLGQWYAICDISLDMHVEVFGQLTVENLDIYSCVDNGWTPSEESCDANPQLGYQYPAETTHYGQILWPAGAPATQVEFEIPFCYGVGSNHHFNRLVFNPAGDGNGSFTLNQIGTVATTGSSNMTNATLADTNPTDSVRGVRGTP